MNTEEELIIPIMKENKILVLNKLTMFQFYNLFYQSIKLKEKNIKISIGNNLLEYKNTILLSLCDYTEILENFTTKKGSMFYEFLSSQIQNSITLENDILLYNLSAIVQDVLNNVSMNIDYDIEEDVEKIIFDLVEFHLDYHLGDTKEILSELIQNLIEKNTSKNIVIFYDSELFDFDFSKFDNCYSFDTSNNKKINDYNLICDKHITDFRFEMIINKLESLWPIEFLEFEVIDYIKEYFIKKASNLSLTAFCEQEYLTYILMNKMYEKEDSIKYRNFQMKDNVKSFLEHI